jgi:hypothetical protein
MGSSVIYLFSENEHHAPNDIDIWVPSGCGWEPPVQTGWYPYTSFYLGGYEKFTLNEKITQVKNYRHILVSTELQVIFCNLTDPREMRNDFDFDVCRCIWSPELLHETNQVIGHHATEPNIAAAISDGVATFRHHNCDVLEDSSGVCRLSERGLERLSKYSGRGFKIQFDPSSAHLEWQFKLFESRARIGWGAYERALYQGLDQMAASQRTASSTIQETPEQHTETRNFSPGATNL